MGEVLLIIQKIQEDKNNFNMLIERMKPLIHKYAKLLYKDEKEDVYSEMVLALWEALKKMEYQDDDGKCIVFLSTALRNRFLELYKKSKKLHDNCTITEINVIESNRVFEEKFCDFILERDLRHILDRYDNPKKSIFKEIIFNEMSDSEIAQKYNVSRQYANRLRRNIFEILRKEYFNF